MSGRCKKQLVAGFLIAVVMVNAYLNLGVIVCADNKENRVVEWTSTENTIELTASFAPVFEKVVLPEEMENQDHVWIRIRKIGNKSVGGEDIQGLGRCNIADIKIETINDSSSQGPTATNKPVEGPGEPEKPNESFEDIKSVDEEKKIEKNTMLAPVIVVSLLGSIVVYTVIKRKRIK